VKCCQFVVSLYPHTLISFGRFALILIKMALIFLHVHVLITFTVSNFEFQQLRLPWVCH